MVLFLDAVVRWMGGCSVENREAASLDFVVGPREASCGHAEGDLRQLGIDLVYSGGVACMHPRFWVRPTRGRHMPQKRGGERELVHGEAEAAHRSRPSAGARVMADRLSRNAHTSQPPPGAAQLQQPRSVARHDRMGRPAAHPRRTAWPRGGCRAG